MKKHFTQEGDCAKCEARNVRVASRQEPFCIKCYKHIAAPVMPKKDNGKRRRLRSRYKRPYIATFRFNDKLFGQDEEDACL